MAQAMTGGVSYRTERTPSVSADAEPHSSGMTATGSHGYFYSLRGAQPSQREARLRRKAISKTP